MEVFLIDAQCGCVGDELARSTWPRRSIHLFLVRVYGAANYYGVITKKNYQL